MIRIIKTFALLLVLSISSVYANEQTTLASAEQSNIDVIEAITTTTRTTIGTFVDVVSKPLITVNEIQCLARNIFYEAASEPEEGKVAVGLVTLNRTADPLYPNSICGVVHQKNTVEVPKKVTRYTLVKTGYFGRTEQRKETTVSWTKLTVCQFSWSCMRVKTPRYDDPRWIESQRIAEELAYGGYDEWREKYSTAMHFHAVSLRPGWKLKRITRTGGHVFYE